MIAYQLDILNFFLNTVECTKDPKDESRYAIPKGAVTTKPPAIQENECQYWNEIEWEIKPNFSGKDYYSKIDKTLKRFVKGESFNSDYTDLIPPSETYIIWKNDSWKVDKILKSEYLKNQCKEKAKSLIASSDWSVLPDVNTTNKSDFENYRSILRNLIINPIEDPIFPIEPNPIWSK